MALVVKNPPSVQDTAFDPRVGKISWRRRTWQPIPVFLLRKSCGQKRLVGYSPQGHKELDRTEAT